MRLKLILALIRRAYAHIPEAQEHISWLIDNQQRATTVADPDPEPPKDAA